MTELHLPLCLHRTAFWHWRLMPPAPWQLGDLETKYDGSFTITINAGNSAVVTSTDIKKVYIGQWSNSRYSGAGYLINNFYDNDSYLGTFKDGNFQGKGTYNFGSGDVYTGGFHKNSF